MAELLDFFNVNIFKKPLGDRRHRKILVSNLDLKLCSYEGLYQTSLPTKFQDFWITISEILVCWQKDAFLWISESDSGRLGSGHENNI